MYLWVIFVYPAIQANGLQNNRGHHPSRWTMASQMLEIFTCRTERKRMWRSTICSVEFLPVSCFFFSVHRCVSHKVFGKLFYYYERSGCVYINIETMFLEDCCVWLAFSNKRFWKIVSFHLEPHHVLTTFGNVALTRTPPCCVNVREGCLCCVLCCLAVNSGCW